MALVFRRFSEEEHATWRRVLEQQSLKRDVQIHPAFTQGLRQLGILSDRIPDLDEVNRKLQELTGFKGVPVEGLEEGVDFFQMLAMREFPIGNFIRAPGDLSYTPAPDVIHDLYGHLPFLANPDYADFCHRLGEIASRYLKCPMALEQFGRLFWFGIEFGLIRSAHGTRIFGAGIASSISECEYALSEKPEVLPFDLDVIRRQDFKVDEFQTRLFLLETAEQLYESLPLLERKVREELENQSLPLLNVSVR